MPLLRYLRKTVSIAKILLKNCSPRSSAPKIWKIYGRVIAFFIRVKKWPKNRTWDPYVWLKNTWLHLKPSKKLLGSWATHVVQKLLTDSGIFFEEAKAIATADTKSKPAEIWNSIKIIMQEENCNQHDAAKMYAETVNVKADVTHIASAEYRRILGNSLCWLPNSFTMHLRTAKSVVRALWR